MRFVSLYLLADDWMKEETSMCAANGIDQPHVAVKQVAHLCSGV